MTSVAFDLDMSKLCTFLVLSEIGYSGMLWILVFDFNEVGILKFKFTFIYLVGLQLGNSKFLGGNGISLVYAGL